jgi:hypothetical protein
MASELKLTCSHYGLPPDLLFIRFMQEDVDWRLRKAKIKAKGLPPYDFCQIMHRISSKSRFMTILELQGNGLGKWALKALAGTGWRFIIIINISKNQLQGKDLSHLSRVIWPFLKCLNLSLNPMGNKAVENICKCDFPRLERLLLKKTRVTGECLKVLPKAHWPNLREISFTECQLGVLDLSFLQRVQWRQNCRLDLYSSQEGVAWGSYLAKVPRSMAHIDVFVRSSHTFLNPPSSIIMLSQIYPHAGNFRFFWESGHQGGGVEYLMASSDDDNQ